MHLTFLDKETQGGGSPTLFATDQGSYVIQGWRVTDAATFTKLDMSEGETCVEIPERLFGSLLSLVGGAQPPRTLATGHNTYVIPGRTVSDLEALAQMDIPGHETAVEVHREAMELPRKEISWND